MRLTTAERTAVARCCVVTVSHVLIDAFMTLTFDLHHRDGAARAGDARPRRTAPSRRRRSCPSAPRPRSRASRRHGPRRRRQIILGNTYHLALRPGDELVADLGGLHRFMGWDGPILTDSGGFQVFSLADAGEDHRRRGDVPLPHRRLAARTHARNAPSRSSRTSAPTSRWCSTSARPADADAATSCARAVDARSAGPSAARRTTRGRTRRCSPSSRAGTNLDLRAECAASWSAMDFPGYALGGFSVGEAPGGDARGPARVRRAACRSDKPRYLMGVGRPRGPARRASPPGSTCSTA